MSGADDVTVERDDHVFSKFSHFPVMAFLRAQTAPLHRELEQRLDIFGRINTLPDYCQVLGRFYGIYSPLERVLWRALAPLKQELMLDVRRKAPLISADLSFCGLSNAAIVELPRWQRIAPFPSIPQALGQLYAIESATLSGPVITRQLRRLLPLKKHGLSFLYSYGTSVPQRSRQFRDVVSSHVKTTAQQDLAVAGAIDTFEMFHWWMSRNEGINSRANVLVQDRERDAT